MSNRKQLTIFLNYVSLGILLPVLNLILLNRGADLKTLPLLIASYSAAVLCFELPSGICADLYGRKTVFLISGACQMLSLILLLFADNWIWLLFYILLNGISRAFSSADRFHVCVPFLQPVCRPDCHIRVMADCRSIIDRIYHFYDFVSSGKKDRIR